MPSPAGQEAQPSETHDRAPVVSSGASPDVSPSHRISGNTPSTEPSNHVFFPALDGLRGVAFLMVFGQHYLLLPWGWAGVCVFFVLSGFLITGILLDTMDRPDRFRTFYVRRTLRIFPLYYAVILLPLIQFRAGYAIWMWPLYLGNYARFLSPLYMLEVPLNNIADLHLRFPGLPFTIHMGHLWSLCVEEQFYLVWPTVVFLLRRRTRILTLCLAVIAVEPIARIVAAQHLPAWIIDAEILYRATPFQLDGLLLGALLALLWRSGHRHRLLAAGRWTALILGSIAAVYLWISIRAYSHDTWLHSQRPGYIIYDYPSWHHTWGMTFVDLLAAALVLCCLNPGNPLYRTMMFGPLRWLGRISYGLYVFHDMLREGALWVVQSWLGPSLHLHSLAVEHGLGAIVGLAATTLLAALSFRFFESPILSLKSRWAPR